MLRAEPRDVRRRWCGGGLLRYLAGWLIAGAAVVAAALVVLGGPEPRRDAVSLPPVRELELSAAVRKAGCAVAGRRRALPAAALGARPARPGIYDRPIPAGGRERAVRGGLVIVEYRADASTDERDRLSDVQRSMPLATILAPGRALRSSQLRVTSYGRQLRCRTINPHAIDALQLFRGRYLGSGPDP